MSIATTELSTTDTRVGFGTSAAFDLIQRAAKLLSRSTLVPPIYQGDAGLSNCVIALNMAVRIGADPLMVMQNLYVVHGRPAWSAQFLIATFNTCGRFSALRYKWTGDRANDTYGCVAYAVEKDTGEILEGSEVTIGLAKKEGWHGKNGSKWQTMPQQMLMYRAAAWFVRAYAPELAMGIQTRDEVEDAEAAMTIDASDHSPPRTVDDLILAQKPKTVDDLTNKAKNEPKNEPDTSTRPVRTLDEYKSRLAACKNASDIEAVRKLRPTEIEATAAKLWDVAELEREDQLGLLK